MKANKLYQCDEPRTPQGPKAALQRENGGAGLRLYLEPLRQPVTCSSGTGDIRACWPSGGDTGHGSEGGPLSALVTVRVQSPSRAEDQTLTVASPSPSTLNSPPISVPPGHLQLMKFSC